MKHRIAPAASASVLSKRVAVYARVSTVKQAEADLSIPDQIAQAKSWCERLGHELVRDYVEPGASGTDESRPVFQQMLSDARSQPRPFDIIVVHSFSRFARDNLAYAIAKRNLNKAGITVQSITQPLADDPTGQMVESILVAFDAYTSKEIGKHTARAMKENARQGFWNGSRPPLGYDVIGAEQRGQKVKKRLEINDAEAAIVRRIFGLYMGAEGVQEQLRARAPRKTPGRLVSSPTLLTGIAVCAHCGAGMTLRTGKGYRYYTCAGRAQKGPTRCGGCAVSMPKVDQTVIETLSDRIFAPDRLTDLVSGYLEKAKAEAQQQRSQLGQLKADLTETEGAIKRLLGMVEAGLMEVDDPALRERLSALKTKRKALTGQLERASDLQPANRPHLTEAKLHRLSETVRAALHTAPPEMRKAYIKLFVDKVVISKEVVELTGPKSLLARAALTDLPNTPAEVITYDRQWRAMGDKTGHWKLLISSS